MAEEPKALTSDAKLQYPKLQLDGYEPRICPPRVSESYQKHAGDNKPGSSVNDLHASLEHPSKEDKRELAGVDDEGEIDLAADSQKPCKYFYYDTPHREETGAWIPVSFPPLPESELADWKSSLYLNGGYLPDGDFGWNECTGEDKEMTMWDVVHDMLLAARGKVTSLTSGDIQGYGISWMTSHLLEQAWQDMVESLTDANFGKMNDILPAHDLTDLSTLRSWLNFPWGQSMEYEIYKAANTLQGYSQVGRLTPEKSIPGAILKQAKGLAILTVARVGLMVTYNVRTGLVVARRKDGSWSPPSAIASFGIGWGAQAGGAVTDYIIVLRTNSAIKTFCGNAHLSIGAGLSAAIGVVGRAAEADMRAGDGGYAACYTYSCSKGAYVGCSLGGNIVKTRNGQNSTFYGSSSISASQILLGSMPQPPAASALYQALSKIYEKQFS